MHYVVTGGAGFIGSHLCEALLADGHQVTALDNFLTGRPGNIEHLRENPSFCLVEHDILQPLPDDKLVELGPPGAVFHLASPASPADFSRIPLQIALINSLGTNNVLEWARQHSARYLVASTSEAYGDPLEHPQREDYFGNVNTIGPRACYDEGKRFGEAITSVYVHEYGLDARIVRIFNTYGPRMNPDDGRLPPQFISQALRGEPMTIYGDGMQTRSFCYVSDMVAGLRAVMDAPPEVRGTVFNVGNPDEREVRDMAEIVRDLCGSQSQIEHRPALQDDPARRCPDITRISTMLGWQPKVPLEEGMARTIEWFRTQI
ncbi:MAG TPA: UDP-glucuronic acid decarboxylase family protein [Chloroflexia bacterium]|nr:UDP-glucuronic acid decarboxylase family protein [Chloroflexia bacterium]